jgi:hypothetical protein
VPAQPAPAPVAASESNNWFLLIALVALGLAILLGFILLQPRALAARPAAPTGSKNRKRGKHRAGAAATIFCTQCGRALGADENFCPQCGAKRRAHG